MWDIIKTKMKDPLQSKELAGVFIEEILNRIANPDKILISSFLFCSTDGIFYLLGFFRKILSFFGERVRGNWCVLKRVCQIQGFVLISNPSDI